MHPSEWGGPWNTQVLVNIFKKQGRKFCVSCFSIWSAIVAENNELQESSCFFNISASCLPWFKSPQVSEEMSVSTVRKYSLWTGDFYALSIPSTGDGFSLFWSSFVTGGIPEANCQTDLQIQEKLSGTGDRVRRCNTLCIQTDIAILR